MDIHLNSKFCRTDMKNATKNKETKCYNCGQLGHISKFCKNKIHYVDAFNITEQETTKDDIKFILDSGASSHMCNDRSLFMEFNDKKATVCLPDDRKMDCEGIGKLAVNLNVGGKSRKVSVEDVLYAPKMKVNLISVAKLNDRGLSVIFKGGKALIFNSKEILIGTATRDGTLYYLDIKDIMKPEETIPKTVETLNLVIENDTDDDKLIELDKQEINLEKERIILDRKEFILDKEEVVFIKEKDEPKINLLAHEDDELKEISHEPWKKIVAKGGKIYIEKEVHFDFDHKKYYYGIKQKKRQKKNIKFMGKALNFISFNIFSLLSM